MRQLLTTCLEGKAIFDLQEENTKIVDLILEAICDIANLEKGQIDIDDIKIEEKIRKCFRHTIDQRYSN